MIERWFCCSLFARHIHQNLHLTSTTAVPPLYWRARLCSFAEDFPGSLHPWRWTPKCWLFEFSVHRILKLDWNGFIVHPTVEVVLRKNYSFCRILFYLSREPARLDLKVLIVRSHFFVSESLNNSLMQWSNWRFCPEVLFSLQQEGEVVELGLWLTMLQVCAAVLSIWAGTM